LAFKPIAPALLRPSVDHERINAATWFPLDKPIPLALISKIVKFRVKENLERAEAKRSLTSRIKRGAFTLIELLVVIAIMGALAALVIPASRSAAAARKKNRARTELKQIESVIELYKIKLNFYPPSALGDPLFNPLYYELAGTRLNNGVYTTLDGVSQFDAVHVNTAFRLSGFANTMQGGGGDEGQQAQNFFKGSLRVGQFLAVPITNMTLKTSTSAVLLGSSVEGAGMFPGSSGGKINPFGYNSANPTNNPNSYDLWLDIFVGGVTFRVCNWSDKPIILR